MKLKLKFVISLINVWGLLDSKIGRISSYIFSDIFLLWIIPINNIFIESIIVDLLLFNFNSINPEITSLS